MSSNVSAGSYLVFFFKTVNYENGSVYNSGKQPALQPVSPGYVLIRTDHEVESVAVSHWINFLGKLQMK